MNFNLGDIVTAWRVDLSKGAASLRRIPQEVRRVEQQTSASMRRMSKSMSSAIGDLDSKLTGGMQRFGDFAEQNRIAFLGISAALTATAGAAEKDFARWEQASTNVRNITGWTVEEMKELEQQMLRLPPAMGRPTELMKGLYQVLSSGVPKQNALDFLVRNSKAAKGNLADLQQTINASTSIVAAYNLETSQTTDVLDKMTKAVDLGKLTFSDLADNIGKGVSIAAQAKVGYEELFATVATLTLSGLSVEEAMTAVRNILVATISPSAEASKSIAETGIQMNLAALQSRGLAGMMGDVAKAVKGNAEATAALFPNIRALNGAMALSSESGLAKFKTTLDDISNSTGKVEKNFANMTENTANKAEALAAAFEKSKIKVGEYVDEGVKPAIEVTTDLLELFNNSPPFMQKFVAGLTTITPLVLGLGLVISPLSKGIAGLSKILTGFGGVAATAGTAIGGLSAATVAAAAVLVPATFIGVYKVTKSLWELTGAADAFNQAFNDIGDLPANMAEHLMENDEAWYAMTDAMLRMKEELHLVGEEWQFTTDRTKENAATLSMLHEKMLAHARQVREVAMVEEMAREKKVSLAEAQEMVRQKLHESEIQSAKTAEQLKKTYRLMTADEFVKSAEQLVSDVNDLTKAGIPAAEMLDMVQRKVGDIRDRSKNFKDVQLPDTFVALEEAAKKGREGLEQYTGEQENFAKGFNEMITVVTEDGKRILTTGIASGIKDAAKEGGDALKTVIAEIEGRPVELKLIINTEDAQRQMKEFREAPDSSGFY